MSKMIEYMNNIDELNKEIGEKNDYLIKTKTERHERIKRLEEEKKERGLRGDRPSVLKISRQIQSLKDETGYMNIQELELEREMFQRRLNRIIFDYYKNGYTINDIFVKEEVPKDIQEELLEKSDFGADSGILFVNKINDFRYNWKYYNPFSELIFKSVDLRDLKLKLDGYAEELIIFDEERKLLYEEDLKKKPSYGFAKIDYREPKIDFKYQIDIDEELDRLDSPSLLYVTARGILNDLFNTKEPLTKEQINRLCLISIDKYHVYNCYTCRTALKRLLNKYKDSIDDDLLKRVIAKNNLSAY